MSAVMSIMDYALGERSSRRSAVLELGSVATFQRLAAVLRVITECSPVVRCGEVVVAVVPDGQRSHRDRPRRSRRFQFGARAVSNRREYRGQRQSAERTARRCNKFDPSRGDVISQQNTSIRASTAAYCRSMTHLTAVARALANWAQVDQTPACWRSRRARIC